MSKKIVIGVDINTGSGVKNVDDLNTEITNSVKSIKSLEDEYARLSQEISSVEIGSDKFKELQGELKSVDSELKNTKKSVEGLDFEAKAGEIGKLAGGVGAVGTAMALTFGDNKDIEAFFKTFAQGIAITQGLKGAMEAASAAQKLFNLSSIKAGIIQAKNIAILIAQKVAMVASAVATAAVTAAQWLWNIAMTANPIGLIIVGVGALIAGIALLIINIESVIDFFLDLNNVILLLLGPIGLLILAYKVLNDETETLVDNDIEATKKAINNARERKKAIQAEIDITKELISEVKHKADLQEKADDLFIKQAEAKGASEEELFQIQKNINEQNLIAKKEEVRLEDLLIKQQLQKAEVMAKEGKLRLKLAVQTGNMDQAQADMNAGLIDKALNDFKESKKEQLLVNSQTIDGMIADNKIFENSRVKNNKKANDKIVEQEKDLQEEIKKINGDALRESLKAHEKAAKDKINAELVVLQREDPQPKIDAELAKTKEINSAIFDASIEAAKAISDAVKEIQNRRSEERLSKIESDFNAENEALKASLTNREISQEQFDAKTKVAEQRKAQAELAAKRKAFNQEKAMALVDIAISTGKAIMSSIAQFGPPPSPLGIIGIASAGVLGGIQAGLVSSQKFKAARGGIVPGVASMIDSVDALLAPGEMVINSNSAQMFPQALSAINQAGGGVSLAPNIPVEGVASNRDTTIYEDTKQPIIKTYVVESEISDSQNRVSRLNRNVSFG